MFAGVITRDAERVVPEGEGTVSLDAGDFEAFPLPDYAAKHVEDGTKSFFVEVEPGINVHVLEVGAGFPLFLQHGNPTSGFLYRKVAAAHIGGSAFVVADDEHNELRVYSWDSPGTASARIDLEEHLGTEDEADIEGVARIGKRASPLA